jgi:hypothetical protein
MIDCEDDNFPFMCISVKRRQRKKAYSISFGIVAVIWRTALPATVPRPPTKAAAHAGEGATS